MHGNDPCFPTAGLRGTLHRGTARVGWMVTLTAAACDLVRMPGPLGAVS